MRTLLGWLALLLGGSGTIACLAGIVAVWPVAHHLAAAADEAIVSAEPVLVATGERLERAEKLLGVVEGDLEELQALVMAAASGQAGSGTEKLATAASGMFEKAHNLLEMLETGVSLVRTGFAFADKPPGSSNSSRAQRIFQDLDHMSGTLTKVDAALQELRTRAAAFQKEGKEAAPLLAVTTKLRRGVGELNERVGRARRALATVQEELTEVRADVAGWFALGPWILTGLLLWIGLGQCCLFRWGRAFLRGKPQA